jgi:hypothetical protein
MRLCCLTCLLYLVRSKAVRMPLQIQARIECDLMHSIRTTLQNIVASYEKQFTVLLICELSTNAKRDDEADFAVNFLQLPLSCQKKKASPSIRPLSDHVKD